MKPHKVRYYLERRERRFRGKMAEVLCVYREVAVLKEAAAGEVAAGESGKAVAIVSYDEKPGVQAIGTTASDGCRQSPANMLCFGRDHEYVRRGTVGVSPGLIS